MKIGLTIPLLLIYLLGFSQTKKFLTHLDTNLRVQNAYIEKYKNSSSFFSSGLAEDELIPYAINEELLNATVFFMFNKMRAKKHRSELGFSSELELVAYNFIEQFSVFKFRKLKNNNARVSKILPFAFKKLAIKKGISKGLVIMPQLIDYKFGKRFYYDKEDDETELKMYYGRKKDADKEDEGLVKTPISTYSYYSFAERMMNNLFTGFSARFAKSKSYSQMACYLALDKKSIYKRKIPRAKAIIILSGKRTAQIIASK